MPLESRFLTVDGVRMHFVESGRGDPAVLLLHGVPASAHLWRNVIPSIAPHARTVAIDLVGLGRSDQPLDRSYDLPSFARFLDGAVKALGLERFVLAGMDLGLLVGQHWALANPDRVRGLVLLEGFIAPVGLQMATFPALNRFFMRLMRVRALAERAIVKSADAAGPFLASGVVKPLAAADLAVYRECFRDPQVRRKVWLEGIGPYTLRPRSEQPGDLTDLVDQNAAKLAASALPKLLLYGEPGAAVTAPMRAWARQHLTNLELVPVGPGKHFLPEDQPEAVGRAIAEFCRRLAKA